MAKVVHAVCRDTGALATEALPRRKWVPTQAEVDEGHTEGTLVCFELSTPHWGPKPDRRGQGLKWCLTTQGTHAL